MHRAGIDAGKGRLAGEEGQQPVLERREQRRVGDVRPGRADRRDAARRAARAASRPPCPTAAATGRARARRRGWRGRRRRRPAAAACCSDSTTAPSRTASRAAHRAALAVELGVRGGVSMLVGERSADVGLADRGRGRDAGVLRLALQIGDDETGLAGERVGGVEHARPRHWPARNARARRAPWRRGPARHEAGARRERQTRDSRTLAASRVRQVGPSGAVTTPPGLASRVPPPVLPARGRVKPLASRSASCRAAMARGDLSRAKPRQPALEVGAVAAKPALGQQHGQLGRLARLRRLRRLGHHVRQPHRQRQLAHRRTRFGQPAGRVDRVETRQAAPAPRRAPAPAADRGRQSARGSATPKAAQSSSSRERSASRISGGVKAASAAVCSARHSRIATPGCVRPARPARWSAEAC